MSQRNYSTLFEKRESNVPEIDEKIKEYYSTVEEKEKKREETNYFQNTKNIYGIHVKEFAAKEEAKIQKRIESLESENKKLWKQIVHQNGMDTIAKNKLTQGKYGRLKKKLTQLQNKKEWLIDQQKNTTDISKEIDKTKNNSMK